MAYSSKRLNQLITCGHRNEAPKEARLWGPTLPSPRTVQKTIRNSRREIRHSESLRKSKTNSNYFILKPDSLISRSCRAKAAEN